jgi:hypothetical protein
MSVEMVTVLLRRFSQPSIPCLPGIEGFKICPSAAAEVPGPYREALFVGRRVSREDEVFPDGPAPGGRKDETLREQIWSSNRIAYPLP